MSEVSGADELLCPFAHVMQRDECEAEKPIRSMGAELAEPVVVDAEARVQKPTILHPVQPEAERRVQNFGLDAVDVLVFQASDRVPPPGECIGVALSLCAKRVVVDR